MTPKPTPAARRILVVDDLHDTAQSLSILLIHLGHRVEFVTDSRLALDAARKLQPGVVLLDIGMPALDGYDVARLLRKEFGAAICIVAITGYGEPEDRRRSREAGFDAHVTKPIDLPELQAILGQSPNLKAGEGSGEP